MFRIRVCACSELGCTTTHPNSERKICSELGCVEKLDYKLYVQILGVYMFRIRVCACSELGCTTTHPNSNLMALQNSHHNFEFSTQYHIYKWSRKIFQLPSCKMAGLTSFEMLENFFSGMTLYWKKSQVKSGSHKRSNLTAWWASHPISTPESNSPRKSTCISSLGRVFSTSFLENCWLYKFWNVRELFFGTTLYWKISSEKWSP